MAREKHRHLLSDPDVNRWFNNTARGSQVTAEVYLRRLGAFCEQHQLTPKTFLSKTDEEIYNIILDLVTEYEQKGNAGSYIHSIVKALKSWLSHNRRDLKGKIRIKGAQDSPTLKDERVPTIDELKKIVLSGDKKSRLASILVAHSGLRLETLGNHLGTDGLVVKDLPEIIISQDGIEFEKKPAKIIVRKELSKAGHQYLTFLSEEGCDYLKDYLEERRRQGENITSESAIITPKIRLKPFIRVTNIGDIIRKPIRKAGYKWRPYVLRSFFDTQLMMAESKGLILRDYRGFWMGHKGDIENRYTTNKKLNPDIVEDMREAYERSQDFLQTTQMKSTSEEQMKDAFRKQLLIVAGFSQDEIDKMDIESINDEEFQTKVKQKLLGVMANNGSKQKVIPLRDVESYIAQGWEYANTLPNDKAIIKIPS